MHRFLTALCLLLLPPGALLAEAIPEPEEMAQRVEELRLRSVNLARDIWLLEQQSDSEAGQLLVFLSVDPRLQDRPQRVELRLGEDLIAEHDYNAAETEALAKGGAQRLYAAALDAGRHVLDARMHTGGNTGSLQREVKLSFRIGATLKTIELRLERNSAGEPELTVREWD